MQTVWERLVERFWFLRGIAAAISLAALAPQITDLSRYEFLRAFHALLSGWNEVAAWVGALVGRLPWLPQLDAATVNATLFAASVGLPSAYYALKTKLYTRVMRFLRLGGTEPEAKGWAGIGFIVLIFLYYNAYFFLPVLAVRWHYIWARIRTEQDDLLTRILFATGAYGMLIAFIASVTMAFVFAVWKLKGYGRGLVLVVSFIATMQVLYWLNAPYVSDWVNELADPAAS